MYEIYGNSIVETAEQVLSVNANNKKFKESPLAVPLRAMFLPTGEHVAATTHLARRRYERLFSHLETILGGQNEVYFIPGALDYPELAKCVFRMSDSVHSVDFQVAELDGTTVAGLGGVPESVKLAQGAIELAPNQFADAEYKRKLKQLWGVDILLTNIAPPDNNDLMDFVKKSPLKLLVTCSTDGDSENYLTQIKDTHILKIGSFAEHAYQALIIEVSKGKFYPDLLDRFCWSQEACEAVASS